MQAIAGIAEIGPLTFGELVHAVKVRVDFEWGRTSALMALVANCHRGRNRRAFRPEDFYAPQLARPRRGNMSVDRLHALRGLFTKRAK